MRILCIDDDPVYLLILKTTLTKSSMEDTLFFAESGENGLKIISTKSIDLLITDLNLPGISGLDLLKQAKNLNAQIEVFIISGLATLNEAIDAIKSGARDFLLKPLNPTMVTEKISMIRDLVNRKKEAEDYRLAKEVIETQANNSICQLELNNEELRTVLSNVHEIINTKAYSDSEKIDQICLSISKVTNANSQQN